MKTARKIKDVQWLGDVALYQLSEPLEGAEYVLVSAVNAPFSGPETYIFPASGPDATSPSDWGELDGSYRGGLSHARALKNAGYTIQE